MVQDAAQNADADHALRLLAEARNKGEGEIHAVRKTLVALGKSAAADTVRAVELLIMALESALDGGLLGAIETHTAALSEAALTLRAQATGQPQPAPAGPGDDAVDAQFKDVVH